MKLGKGISSRQQMQAYQEKVTSRKKMLQEVKSTTKDEITSCSAGRGFPGKKYPQTHSTSIVERRQNEREVTAVPLEQDPNFLNSPYDVYGNSRSQDEDSEQRLSNEEGSEFGDVEEMNELEEAVLCKQDRAVKGSQRNETGKGRGKMVKIPMEVLQDDDQSDPGCRGKDQGKHGVQHKKKAKEGTGRAL